MNIFLIVATTIVFHISLYSLDRFSDSNTHEYEFKDYSDDTDWLFEDDMILDRNSMCKILDDNIENFVKADNSPYYPFDDKKYHDDNFEIRSFGSY